MSDTHKQFKWRLMGRALDNVHYATSPQEMSRDKRQLWINSMASLSYLNWILSRSKVDKWLSLSLGFRVTEPCWEENSGHCITSKRETICSIKLRSGECGTNWWRLMGARKFMFRCTQKRELFHKKVSSTLVCLLHRSRRNTITRFRRIVQRSAGKNCSLELKFHTTDSEINSS